MNIFNIKKDFGHFKQTGKDIKGVGKKMGQKHPVIASICRSIFIIIKWLIILWIILSLIAIAYYFFITKPQQKIIEEERKERIQREEEERRALIQREADCKTQCDYPLRICGIQIRPSTTSFTDNKAIGEKNAKVVACLEKNTERENCYEKCLNIKIFK